MVGYRDYMRHSERDAGAEEGIIVLQHWFEELKRLVPTKIVRSTHLEK